MFELYIGNYFLPKRTGSSIRHGCFEGLTLSKSQQHRFKNALRIYSDWVTWDNFVDLRFSCEDILIIFHILVLVHQFTGETAWQCHAVKVGRKQRCNRFRRCQLKKKICQTVKRLCLSWCPEFNFNPGWLSVIHLKTPCQNIAQVHGHALLPQLWRTAKRSRFRFFLGLWSHHRCSKGGSEKIEPTDTFCFSVKYFKEFWLEGVMMRMTYFEDILMLT